MGSGLKRDLVRPGGIRSGSSVPGVVYPYTVYISRGCTNNLLQPVAHIASIQYLVWGLIIIFLISTSHLTPALRLLRLLIRTHTFTFTTKRRNFHTRDGSLDHMGFWKMVKCRHHQWSTNQSPIPSFIMVQAECEYRRKITLFWGDRSWFFARTRLLWQTRPCQRVKEVCVCLFLFVCKIERRKSGVCGAVLNLNKCMWKACMFG